MAKPRKVEKKSRRAKTKNSALRPELNLKTRQHLIDYDYVNKLNEEEKAWLNKFTEEYTIARLDSKKLKNNLHNTDALKKDCYDRNNARNRCIMTRVQAQGLLADIAELRDNPVKEDDEVEELLDQSEELNNTDSDGDQNGDESENL